MADEDLLAGLEDEGTDDAGIEPESFDTAPEQPQEETVDPRDARLDKIEATLSRLGALDPNKINPALGRIGAIQSALDGLSKRDVLAEIDPRVSANEDLTVTLARTLSNSALVDDEDKASLRSALRAVEQSKSVRERAQMMSELKAELATTDVAPAETSDPVAALWDAASEEVRDMASEYGVSPDTIPWDDIQRDAQNNPTKVARVALKWFEANKQDPSTERVIERRRAAGSGSPAREGAATSLENDKNRLMEQGIPISDEAARKRVAASLGLEL